MSSHAPTISIPRLRDEFDGRVIAPGDPDYDQARVPFYGGVDRHPAVIIRPADAAGVARVVALARDSGLDLAVRSGGHSPAWHSVNDGGIVLDLGAMKALDIDVDARTAWAQTGLTAGEYTTAANAYGLATGFGDTASVGVGGITLSGGVGYLVRKYGLTVDDLLAAEVVTADGQQLRVDDQSHPDLFWAIRGGGGNFGVATRFRFRLHPVDQVLGGMLLLPATPEVIAGFVAAAEAAPEELSGIVNVMPAPPMPMVPPELHGQLVIMAMLVWAGPVEEGQAAVAPFRALATPLADLVAPMPYPGIYPPGDESFHPTAIGHTMFVDAIDQHAAETILEHLEDSDATVRAAQLRVLGWGDGQGAGRRHRLRPSRVEDHGEPDLVLPGPGRPAAPPVLGGPVRGRAPAGRPGRLRRVPRRRGRGPGPPGVPADDLGAAGRGQGPLRPRQPVPGQPQHPARHLSDPQVAVAMPVAACPVRQRREHLHRAVDDPEDAQRQRQGGDVSSTCRRAYSPTMNDSTPSSASSTRTHRSRVGGHRGDEAEDAG